MTAGDVGSELGVPVIRRRSRPAVLRPANIVAATFERTVIEKILTHLGLDSQPPASPGTDLPRAQSSVLLRLVGEAVECSYARDTRTLISHAASTTHRWFDEEQQPRPACFRAWCGSRSV
jgi:hypothetical protein